MTLFCCCCLADAPSEPRDIAIDKFDSSSVSLKWKTPNSDGGNPIKGKRAVPALESIVQALVFVGW